MKKSLALLFLLVSFSFLLPSCSFDKEARLIEKIDKLYNESSGYETVIQMNITNRDKETNYKLIEKYTHDDIIRLEILEPIESKGISLEYRDDKIFLNHSSIGQTLTLRTVKNFDKGILLVNFFNNLDNITSIQVEELDGKDYYLLEYETGEENRYNNQRIIYLNKKNLDPYLMKVLDEDGNVRLTIKYEGFKYIR